MHTTASKITMVRIVLIPVFLLFMYLNLPFLGFVAYIFACISDFLDGYVARHYNQITSFGKFMDPLADKMLVLAAMCVFIERGQMPAWAVAVVLFREFAVSGLRMIASEKGIVIAAGWSGKVKTFATMIALGAMMLLGSFKFINTSATAVILITTVYSGAEYFVKNGKVLSDN